MVCSEPIYSLVQILEACGTIVGGTSHYSREIEEYRIPANVTSIIKTVLPTQFAPAMVTAT